MSLRRVTLSLRPDTLGRAAWLYRVSRVTSAAFRPPLLLPPVPDMSAAADNDVDIALRFSAARVAAIRATAYSESVAVPELRQDMDLLESDYIEKDNRELFDAAARRQEAARRTLQTAREFSACERALSRLDREADRVDCRLVRLHKNREFIENGWREASRALGSGKDEAPEICGLRFQGC
eukprot:IDg5113t1